MIHVRVDGLFALAPTANEVYLRGLGCLNAVLACFGLLKNAHRPAHFLAQVLHESGGLHALQENLNYRAERLMVVWPTRFPTRDAAERVAGNPEALANAVYDFRPELGNLVAGDGWRYRGRGLPQLTGRHNYQVVGLRLDIDLLAHPELVTTEAYAWPVACAFWHLRGLSRFADADDVRGVSRAMVGDTRTVDARAAWLEKTRALVEVA